jgi:hypothetical protein
MMKRPRISKFPLHKPFERLDPTTQLSEVALRLVENIHSDDPVIFGTATVLCGNLAVTAKHVFEESRTVDPSTPSVTINKHLSAVQVLPRPEYIVWYVAADIALLRLSMNPGRSDPDKPYEWRQSYVNPFAPEVG